MSRIPLDEIYQQRINFLIGAGASSGLFPTLWLAIKDSNNPEKEETIETLATKLEQLGHEYRSHQTLLFMYYYQNIISPVCNLKLTNFDIQHADCIGVDCEICKQEERQKEAISNYETFIDSIVRLLQNKNEFQKRCNLFTTNYDGCVPLIADKLIKKGELEFFINDGACGFLDRTLSARNFNNYICQSGVFGRNSSDIPQINFINLHGSAYWRKSDNNIAVDYKNTDTNVIIPEEALEPLTTLHTILNNKDKTTKDVLSIDVKFPEAIIDSFWSSYNKLPIVNPTKWKFHETVFEEHYYQMLRLLSYQLEEPNSILISFAFSFADEHILNLVKRSLSNPKLQVFICCFDKKEHQVMSDRFRGYRNISLISFDDAKLDFTKFNKEVFNADLLRGELE